MNKLGVIVNPIAGMGGAVGLKGTDGSELLERAKGLGAVPRSENRAQLALDAVTRMSDELEILTYGGSMGENSVLACGMRPTVVGSSTTSTSTTEDTRDAARTMAKVGVDLLLFAGGDGTARDIHDAVGTSVTSLGIPAGVKIQSAVFATNPTVAGQVASSYLSGGSRRVKQAEVMDIDEDDYRRGVLSARLYGYLEIPDDSSRLQNRKAASAPSEKSVHSAIAADIFESMNDECYYIIGPGTTCMSLLERFSIEGTVLGVDIIRAGRLVGKDLGETKIIETIDDHDCRLILTPVGGQGFLLGRGNQQISPAVIGMVGKENISVIATTDKITSLGGRPLLVDTGDVMTDSYLSGYYRVTTGFRETTVYRVSDCT